MTKIDQITPIAVVVGMGLGGLGVTRSLAKQGVPVIAVHDVSANPEIATRLPVFKKVLPIRTPDLVDGLLDLASGLAAKPVLYATMRLPMVQISEHRDRLERAYRMRLPSHELVQAMESKDRLKSVAEAAGILMPRTVVVDSESRLGESNALRFPVILKPADNNTNYMAHFKKGYVVDTWSDLTERVREIWPHYRNIVAQEWIDGDDQSIFFCKQYRDATRKPLASFVGRKLLSWPLGVGAAAACVAEFEHSRRVESLANAFFDTAGVVGFCSIEFKRNPVSGDFYLIEPTIARTEQLEEIATLNGINLPYVGYCDLIGRPVPEQVQLECPQTWSDSLSVRWARQALKEKSMTPPALRVGCGRVHDAHFRFGDPMPGILNLITILPNRIAEPLRKLFTGLRSRSDA